MKKKFNGFTLAEIMVASTIAFLILGIIVFIVTNMLNKYKTAQIKLDIEREVNLAMDGIAKDLKGAVLAVGDPHLGGIVQSPDQSQPESESLYFTVTSSDYDPLSAQSFDFEKNYRQIRYYLSSDKKILYKQLIGLDKEGALKEKEPLLTKGIIVVPQDKEGRIIFSVRHPLLDASKPYHEIDNPYQMSLFEIKIELEYSWGGRKITYSAVNKVRLEMP